MTATLTLSIVLLKFRPNQRFDAVESETEPVEIVGEAHA
jgi:hypothetical protein